MITTAGFGKGTAPSTIQTKLIYFHGDKSLLAWKVTNKSLDQMRWPFNKKSQKRPLRPCQVGSYADPKHSTLNPEPSSLKTLNPKDPELYTLDPKIPEPYPLSPKP